MLKHGLPFLDPVLGAFGALLGLAARRGRPICQPG